MSDVAIRVGNLSKQYPSLRQAQYKRQAQDKPHRRPFDQAQDRPAGALQDDPRIADRGGAEPRQGDKGMGRQGDKETRRHGDTEKFSPSPPLPISASPAPGLHLPHHRADRGLRRDPRAGGLPAGGGLWFQPRTDRARESWQRFHLQPGQG
jgi:hypothetical protein